MILTESHPVSTMEAYNGFYKNINSSQNLNRIARKSNVFLNSFCVNGSSNNSISSLLTGNHSHANGFNPENNTFNFSQENFVDLLQKEGYETCLIGRWDLSKIPKYFDDWNVLVDSSVKYNPEFLNTKGKKRIEGYSTDIITDLALNWLQNRKSIKPFFLLIQYNGTTYPWMPAIRHLNLFDDQLIPEPPNLFDDFGNKASPSRYQSMKIQTDLNLKQDLFFQEDKMPDQNSTSSQESLSQRNINLMTYEQFSAWSLAWRSSNEAFTRENNSEQKNTKLKFQRFVKNFLRCIYGIDENIGRLEELLSETNRNVFFIYTSSTGRFLGEHGWFGSKWMYEESFRVPLIINSYLPSISQTIVETPCQIIDIAPTILEFSDSKELLNCNGESLLNYISNKDVNQTNRMFVYFHHNEFPCKHMVAKHYGLRSSKYKIIHYYQFDEWELFDLINDPNENINLYSSQAHAPIVKEFKELILSFRKKYSDTTNINIMPEEWRKFYRGPEARKKQND